MIGWKGCKMGYFIRTKTRVFHGNGRPANVPEERPMTLAEMEARFDARLLAEVILKKEFGI